MTGGSSSTPARAECCAPMPMPWAFAFPPLDAVVLEPRPLRPYGRIGRSAARSALPPPSFCTRRHMQPKYAGAKIRRTRSIGMPESSRQALDAVRDRIVWTASATEVVPGVWCTGEIPRLPAERADRETGFFLDAECREPDPMADDQALFIDTTDGLVVIAGCAHCGRCEHARPRFETDRPRRRHRAGRRPASGAGHSQRTGDCRERHRQA